MDFVRSFLRSLTAKPLAPTSFEALLAQAMVSTPLMLAGAFTRVPQSNADVLAALKCPVTFLIGDQENVVTPAMAAFVKSKVPQTQQLVYPGVGHLPHLEAEAAFATDLAKFARH